MGGREGGKGKGGRDRRREEAKMEEGGKRDGRMGREGCELKEDMEQRRKEERKEG